MSRARARSAIALDRYVLGREIAAGGMATVHLGRVMGAAGFTRVVAIKRLHPQFAKDPEFVSMFLDEAHLAARIRHPNVVPVLDVEQHDGEIFLVMEYVQGESLAALLRTARERDLVPTPPRMALAIVTSVLHGLHAAHETVDDEGRPLGIVHRDVSPHNVLVGADGIVRLLDFGVAKAAWRMQTTREGQLKGKLSYMAPEQVQGATIDRRVDVYAASIVLWELLTGTRLYGTREPGDVMMRILASVVEPPSKHNAAVGPELDALVLKGLSRIPQRRFASAQEMASAIEAMMPLATPREIGAWVERLAGAKLAERAAAIRSTEREDTGPSALGDPGPDTVATAPTQRNDVVGGVTMAKSAPVVGTKRSLFAGGGLLLIGALSAFGFRLAKSNDARAPSDFSTVPSGATATSAEVPAVTPSIEAAASALEAPSGAPAASSASPRAPLRAVGSARSPNRATLHKKNCDPPYYVDSKGIHVPKPECLE